MRTIKFRGKRIDDGGWVYGVPQVTGISGVYMVWSKTVTSQRRDDSMSVYDKVEQAEVIPETVGQYTGLKDKNGVDIYEGDILRATPNGEHIGAVEYDVNEAQWFGAKDFLGYAVAYSGAEIIGNIHDNPELMEV